MKEMLELWEVEENKGIYMGDKEERRWMVD